MNNLSEFNLSDLLQMEMDLPVLNTITLITFHIWLGLLRG